MSEKDDSKITPEEVKIALDRLRSLSHGDQLQDPSVCGKHRIELLRLKPSDPYYTIKVCPICVANEVNRVHEDYPEIKKRMDDKKKIN